MAAPPAREEISDTFPNPSNAVARAGFGKLFDYVTGLLGTTGNAVDARNALGIGPVISFRNLLINANFAINQRVYTSGTATTSANQYTLDRWRVVVSGQSVTFPAATPDRTVIAPAGGYEQVIEGASVVGGVYTLSWTGTATATVNGTSILNGGSTASLPANANATIRFSAGTVGLVQFELGAAATPFERRPLGLELALCQRYYSKSYQQSQAPGTNTGVGNGIEDGPSTGTVFGAIISRVLFPMPARISSPTVSFYDAIGGGGVTVFNPTQQNGQGVTGPFNLSERGFCLSTLSSSPQRLCFHWTQSSEL